MSLFFEIWALPAVLSFRINLNQDSKRYQHTNFEKKKIREINIFFIDEMLFLSKVQLSDRFHF